MRVPFIIFLLVLCCNAAEYQIRELPLNVGNTLLSDIVVSFDAKSLPEVTFQYKGILYTVPSGKMMGDLVASVLWKYENKYLLFIRVKEPLPIECVLSINGMEMVIHKKRAKSMPIGVIGGNIRGLRFGEEPFGSITFAHSAIYDGVEYLFPKQCIPDYTDELQPVYDMEQNKGIHFGQGSELQLCGLAPYQKLDIANWMLPYNRNRLPMINTVTPLATYPLNFMGLCAGSSRTELYFGKMLIESLRTKNFTYVKRCFTGSWLADKVQLPDMLEWKRRGETAWGEEEPTDFSKWAKFFLKDLEDLQQLYTNRDAQSEVYYTLLTDGTSRYYWMDTIDVEKPLFQQKSINVKVQSIDVSVMSSNLPSLLKLPN